MWCAVLARAEATGHASRRLFSENGKRTVVALVCVSYRTQHNYLQALITRSTKHLILHTPSSDFS